MIKQHKTRLFSVIAILILLLNTINPMVVAASEQVDSGIVEDQGFVFNAETKTITAYTGEEKDIVIPQQFETDGKTIEVLKIGSKAFKDKEITSVQIPEGIKEIADEAFQNNELKSVDLPSSITTLGERVFLNNDGIIIQINNDKAKLNLTENTFDGVQEVKNLVEIKEGKNEAELTEEPKKQTKKINVTKDNESQNIGSTKQTKDNQPKNESVTPQSLGYEFNSETGTITKYVGNEETVKIPSSFVIDGKEVEVKVIGVSAFRGNTTTKSVHIPSTVRIIDNNAFSLMSSLEEMIIDEGLEVIGDSAFSRTALTELTIPSTIKKLGGNLFSFSYTIEKVTINKLQEEIDSIAHAAFRTSVPNRTIEVIYQEQMDETKRPEFQGYEFDFETGTITNYLGNKETLEIPNYFMTERDGKATRVNVEKIGASAFENNVIIKHVHIPATVKAIETSAFKNSKNLEQVTISEGMTYYDGLRKISEEAFAGTKLTEVVIPKSIDVLENNIFDYSTTEKVTIKRAKAYIDKIAVNAFHNDKEIEVVYEHNTKVVSEKENVVLDPMLRKGINRLRSDYEERDDNQPITKEDLKGFKSFTLSNVLNEEELWEIKSIQGLQHLTDTTGLTLSGIQVEDFSPIKTLTSLRTLGIYGLDDKKIPLKDISFMENMTELQYVRIIGTTLEDLSPLESLSDYEIDNLHLENNEIKDVSPLKNVNVTNQLFLAGNHIADFSPLEGKRAFKSSRSGNQLVIIKPETEEFENPLITVHGDYVELKHDFIRHVDGDLSKLQLTEIPEADDRIEVNYRNESLLIIDLLTIKNKAEEPDHDQDKEEPGNGDGGDNPDDGDGADEPGNGDAPEDPEQTFSVYFDVIGLQDDTVLNRLYTANVKVWDESGKEIHNPSNVSITWNLPDGKYSYEVTHRKYKNTQGEFVVNGKDTIVKVRPQYDIEQPGVYKYPTISSLEVTDKQTGRVIGKGTFDGQIISVVVSNKEDRKLIEERKAGLKLETENALSFESFINATIDNNAVSSGPSGSISIANGGPNGATALLRPYGMFYINLFGKGGLQNHYGVVLKESEDQHAIIYETSADGGYEISHLYIPTGGNQGRDYFNVGAYVQLVNHGEKAVEPLKQIEGIIGKKPSLIKAGGAFEGWYHNRDWQQKFDFNKPITKDMQVSAKFSNSTSVIEFPDPFYVYLDGPLTHHNTITGETFEPRGTIYNRYVSKAGKWKKLEHRTLVNQIGDDLTFKFDLLDENYELAFIHATYSGEDIPVNQHEDGSFSITPAPAQNSSYFSRNTIHYNFIEKKYKTGGPFDVNKLHPVHVINNLSDKAKRGDGTLLDFDFGYVSSNREYSHFTYAQTGDTVPLELVGRHVDDVTIKSKSGKEFKAKLKKVEKDPAGLKPGLGFKTFYYEFIMPDEPIDLIVKGYSSLESKIEVTNDFIFDNGVIKEYIGTEDEVIIPDYIEVDGEEIPVIEIGIDAFKDKGLVSVQLPSTLKVIGFDAFRDNNLKEIILPDGLEDIKSGAFSYNELQSIEIPSSVKSIKNGAFQFNKLEEVTLHEGIEEIDHNVFAINKLKELVIPSTVKSLGHLFLRGNDGIIVYIDNHEGDVELKIDPFYDVKEVIYLKDVYKGKLKKQLDFLNDIDLNRFSNEISTEAKVLLEQATSIYENEDATQKEVNNITKELDAIIILIKEQPADIKKLEEIIKTANSINLDEYNEEKATRLKSIVYEGEAFLNNEKATQEEIDYVVYKIELAIADLEEVEVKNPEDLGFKFSNQTITGYEGTEKNLVIPSHFLINGEKVPVTKIGFWALRNKGLKSVVLPSTLTEIESGAFANNELEQIVLPQGLEKIESFAFENNKLRFIEVPRNIKELKIATFKSNQLKQVVLQEGLQEIGNLVFENNKLTELYIPATVTKLGDRFVVNNNDIIVIVNNKEENIQYYDEIHTKTFKGVEEVKFLGDIEKVNKSALEAMIEVAESLDTTGKTEKSIQALEAAITSAKAIVEDDDASEEQVESAIASLEEAIANLEDIPAPEVDKSALIELIDEAEALDLEGMTEVSVANLREVLGQAKAVVANDEATEEEVDQAVKVLEAAIEALEETDEEVPSQVDKSELKAMIEVAEEIDTTGKTDSSIQVLEAAITSAKAIVEDDDASEEQVESAIASLEEAIANLEDIPAPEVDKSALIELIDEAEALDLEGKTEKSIANLLVALGHAKVVVANKDATQADVNEAKQTLQQAVHKLADKPEKPAVDKAKLNKALNKAKAIDQSKLTAKSAEHLQQAIAVVENVLASDEATQADIDNAITQLEAVLAKLKEKDIPVEKPEEEPTEKPSKPETPEKPEERPVEDDEILGGITEQPNDENHDEGDKHQELSIQTKESSSKELPSTATTIFNLLIVGLMILLMGILISVIRRKRQKI